MEKSGIILPVSKLEIIYSKPAFFDDTLEINVELTDLPTSRLIFNYTIKRNNMIIVKGSTTLAFFDKELNKPIRCPDYIFEKVSELFK